MNWNDIKIGKMNTIDSINTIIQVINLLEHILDSRDPNYKIIHEYLMEAEGSFHAAFDNFIIDSLYHRKG